MPFEVLITCNNETRSEIIGKIKKFKDVKNIQQRKNENELLIEIESNDEGYVKNNVIKRILDIEDVLDASMISKGS